MTSQQINDAANRIIYAAELVTGFDLSDRTQVNQVLRSEIRKLDGTMDDHAITAIIRRVNAQL